MMRFRLLIEYKGSAYFGWQIQNGQVTIQGEIEKALKTIYSQDIGITGAGRTDTGVHARGQVAHFDLEKQADPGRLLRSLNGILKPDIRIKEISLVTSDFHARYSALSREYHYYIAPQPTALYEEFAWHLTYDLDLNRMNKAATFINGRKDFKSFCRAKSDVKHHYCDIIEAQWLKKEEFIVFVIRADRFLHGMVRAIVGTFVDIGRSKLDISGFKGILAGKNRSLASQAAPAKGLILEKIYY
jgi:tRNA pseudouridine38-40 synthase